MSPHKISPKLHRRNFMSPHTISPMLSVHGEHLCACIECMVEGFGSEKHTAL